MSLNLESDRVRALSKRCAILRHTALDEESDEPDMGHECLGEGDNEEALSSDSDTALQA